MNLPRKQTDVTSPIWLGIWSGFVQPCASGLEGRAQNQAGMRKAMPLCAILLLWKLPLHKITALQIVQHTETANMF